tara:strand:- start:1330 stop:2109 length:780 start_codon:yes stop_codon:yes gene_type:complete
MGNIIKRKADRKPQGNTPARPVRTGDINGIADTQSRVQIRNVMAAAALFLCSGAANAIMLDFEEFNPASGSLINFAPVMNTQGFTWTTQSREQLYVTDNGQRNVPNTGSNTLLLNGSGNGRNQSSVTLARSGGEAFNLDSLLALEGRNTTTGFFQFSAVSINVVGNLVAGGSLATSIVLDLFAQENNVLDAQSVSFADWTGLSSVVFTGIGGPQNGYSFALDDVAVSIGNRATAISTPATAALFGLGLAAAGLMRRRKI